MTLQDFVLKNHLVDKTEMHADDDDSRASGK